MVYLKDTARSDAKLKSEKFDENTVIEMDEIAKEKETYINQYIKSIKEGYETIEKDKVKQIDLENE